MTEQAATVLVECLGISTRVGFNVHLHGGQPGYVEFEPGKKLEVKRAIAEHLRANDPTKFLVEELPVEAAPAPEPPAQAAPAKKAAAKGKGRK